MLSRFRYFHEIVLTQSTLTPIFFPNPTILDKNIPNLTKLLPISPTSQFPGTVERMFADISPPIKFCKNSECCKYVLSPQFLQLQNFAKTQNFANMSRPPNCCKFFEWVSTNIPPKYRMFADIITPPRFPKTRKPSP